MRIASIWLKTESRARCLWRVEQTFALDKTRLSGRIATRQWLTEGVVKVGTARYDITHWYLMKSVHKTFDRLFTEVCFVRKHVKQTVQSNIAISDTSWRQM